MNGKRERMPAVAVPARSRDLPAGLTGARTRADLFDVYGAPSLAVAGGQSPLEESTSGTPANPLTVFLSALLFFIRTGAADSQYRTQLQKIEVEDR